MKHLIRLRPSPAMVMACIALTVALGGTSFAAVSYGFRLPHAPTPHYLNTGAPPTPECPGSVTNPQAAAGHFCAYESSMVNFTQRRTCDPETSGCLFAS